MQTKTVKRYYCDFCKKSGGSSYHMKKHESSCTKNPNRVCGMCAIVGGSQKTIRELTEAAKFGLESLRNVASGCPACMLAAIRQTTNDGLTDAHIEALQEFDFRKECEAAWAEFKDRESEYNYLAAN